MGERIHFGALKLQDRDKIAASRQSVPGSSNANTASFSDSAQRNIAQRQAVLQQMEQEKKARTIAVPTNDSHVKLKLRELGEVICFYGEGERDWEMI